MSIDPSVPPSGAVHSKAQPGLQSEEQITVTVVPSFFATLLESVSTLDGPSAEIFIEKHALVTLPRKEKPAVF